MFKKAKKEIKEQQSKLFQVPKKATQTILPGKGFTDEPLLENFEDND